MEGPGRPLDPPKKMRLYRPPLQIILLMILFHGICANAIPNWHNLLMSNNYWVCSWEGPCVNSIKFIDSINYTEKNCEINDEINGQYKILGDTLFLSSNKLGENGSKYPSISERYIIYQDKLKLVYSDFKNYYEEEGIGNVIFTKDSATNIEAPSEKLLADLKTSEDRVNKEFTKIENEKRKAEIFISTDPPICEIFIGNKFVGKSNIMKCFFYPGTQKVTFKSSEFECSILLKLKIGINPGIMVDLKKCKVIN